MFVSWYPVIYAVFAGVLLGIGNRIPALWFCSLISFCIVMLWVARAKNARAAFWYATTTGIVAHGFAFHSLFFDALPFDWIGLSGALSVAVAASIWGITVLTFALPFGAFLTVAWRTRTNTWTDILLFPSAFVIADWFGAWVFSIVNYGPFALLGPNFLMNSPSYQLATSGALLQVAWFGGIYALAFVLAASGVMLYRMLFSKDAHERIILKVLGAALLVVLAAGTLWFEIGQTSPLDSPLKIALVTIYEPSVFAPSKERLDNTYEKIIRILSEIPADTDIIALPEDSRFLENWHERDGNTLPVSGTPIILDSASVRESGSLYSRVEHFDSKTKESEFSYKQFLMPLGEEHPYLYQFALRLIGQGELVKKLRTMRGFKTKPLTPPIDARGTPITALLCSEGMSPIFYAAEARMGAEVFFNLASHTWFHGSHTIHTIAKWNGQVRAVESRRWFARSGDASPAFLLDPYGRTSAEGTWNVESAIYGTVYPRNDMTPYLFFGQWILILPLSVLLIYATRYLYRRKIE